MKKTKRNNKSNPDPYEDVVRRDKLDPYEALLNSNNALRQSNNSFE